MSKINIVFALANGSQTWPKSILTCPKHKLLCVLAFISKLNLLSDELSYLTERNKWCFTCPGQASYPDTGPESFVQRLPVT